MKRGHSVARRILYLIRSELRAIIILTFIAVPVVLGVLLLKPAKNLYPFIQTNRELSLNVHHVFD